MTQWVEGTVIDNIHWSDTLFSLRVMASVRPFVAGQYGKIALEVNGERIQRAYSYVNPPDDPVLEFYAIDIADGILSPKLRELSVGDLVQVSKQGNGFFTLDEVPHGRHLWLMASGTAIGPYLSILRTTLPWQRFEKIILIHAVRYRHELTYQALQKQLLSNHGKQLIIQSFISRETHSHALSGRIPQAIISGELEERIGLQFAPGESQVMICGNPDMVKDTQDALLQKGLHKNLRRSPGEITLERYW